MDPQRQREILQNLGPGWSVNAAGYFVGPEDTELRVGEYNNRARLRQRSHYAELGPFAGESLPRTLGAEVKKTIRKFNPPGRCW